MRFSIASAIVVLALVAGVSSCTKDPETVPEGTVRLISM